MQSFEWVDAKSVDHATALLGDTQGRIVAKAGGVDLLDLIKEGIVTPTRIVNLNLIGDLRGCRVDQHDGLRLGALTTLAEIAADPHIKSRYGALAQAAAHAATPQVRNVATLGGNLLQRPRCWYFRNEQFHRSSSAAADMNERELQYHAIFDNQTTAMVHASTLATALIAYNASVHISGSRGSHRSVLLKDFLLPPSMHSDRDAALEGDELITHISVPSMPSTTRIAYHKQTERESYDWPLFDVAVVLTMNERVVKSASIVIGGVAPTPLRALAAEALIVNRELDNAIARDAARATVDRATPFECNRYKVQMLEVVLRRTLLGAVA